MKIKFDIECSPQEAREFFGLPDVTKMQEAAMEQLEEQLRENIKNMDSEAMMKTWLPASMQSWAQMQKMWMGGVNNSTANAEN